MINKTHILYSNDLNEIFLLNQLDNNIYEMYRESGLVLKLIGITHTNAMKMIRHYTYINVINYDNKFGGTMGTSKVATKRNAGKFFSEKAIKFLVSRAGKSTAKAIANQLGRTEKSIRRKAEKMGLSLAVK
jgi:hypothetical protein